MADEMIFGVGFDVKSAEAQALKDAKVVLRNIENSLGKEGIEFKVGVTGGSDAVKQAQATNKAIREQLQTVEIKTELKDLDFQQLRELTSKISAEMSKLNFDLKGISDEDLAILNRYKSLLGSVNTAMRELNKNSAVKPTVSKEELATLKAQTRELQLKANQEAKNARIAKQNNDILKSEERTINQINAKLKVQQGILKNLDPNSTEFAKTNKEVQRLSALLSEVQAKTKGVNNTNMSRLRSSVSGVNKEYSRQLTYVQRLVERAGVYGALFAAGNFIRNVREVTAEFELQRVSLTAMMQSAADADKLFEQTVAAAVESPFQIKDLIQYTKQLAAFGVENDNLFDTTQMLADITAGLGTDFGRIALAYGQIRARGFLAGTELKQLTELGLAFPEMLAERLSAVEGTAVTVADVFDRISNREITFGQVENIFKELTEDGGRFYEMQEKQAKTLAGLWSNLQDVTSVMYADIGEESYDAMRGSIELLKSLIENWRIVADVVTAAGVAYALVWNNKRKLNATTKLFNSILGEEVAGRYAAAKATAAQAASQSRINATIAASLNGERAKISLSRLSEKQLLRQAIATNSLSKEEAVRAIVLKQTTKAERTLMIQTGLLDKAQVRAALSSIALARGGTLLGRAFRGVGVAVRNAWNGLSTFFKGNWITIALAAIGAIWSEWSSKSEALEEELLRVSDAHKGLLQELDKIDTKYKGDIAKGVDALTKKYHELGLAGLSALKNLDPGDSLIDQYKQLRDGLESASANIKIIKQELAQGFGGWEFGGLFGENIETDIKDLNKSLSSLFVVADVGKSLKPFQDALKVVTEDLSDAEKSRFADILDDQRLYESEIEYLERLAKAYYELEDSETGAYTRITKGSYEKYLTAFGKLTSVQQKKLGELSDAYADAVSDIDEFGHEIDKRIEDIASSLNIQKMIAEGDTEGLQDVAIQIKAVFEDPSYSFNEFAKQIGAKMFGEKLQIPLYFFAEFDLPELAELNSIQQALVGSGLFSKEEVANIRDLISAQKALNNVVQEEAELQKIVTEANEEGYNKMMRRYADEAKASLKVYNEKLAQAKASQAVGVFTPEEFKETEFAIQRLEEAIDGYNDKLKKSQVPFAEYVEKNKKMADGMSENTKIAYEVARAIGVMLGAITSGGGSGGEDPFITLMKNRASVMKDFQGGVEDLNKYLSESGALSQEQDIMRSRAVSVGIDVEGLSGTTEELSEWYADAIKQVQAKIAKVGGKQFEELTVEAILSKDIKSKTTKAYQDLLQFIFNAKTDFDTKTLQNNLKAELARISDEIKRSKEAQDFMSNILSTTGDEQLAREIASAVFGDIGGELEKQMREQVKVAFGGDGMSAELSDAVNKAIKGTKIDYKALQDLIPLIGGEENQKQAQALVDAGIAANAKYTENLIKSLNTFQDYETRRTAIAKKGEEERAVIRGLGLTKELEEQQLAASKRKQIEETAKVDVEEFESSEDYIRIFMDLEKISTQTIDSMRSKLKEYIKQLQATGASAEVLKPLIENFEKLNDESLERKPLESLRKGIENYVTASKEYQRTKKEVEDAETELAKAEADKKTAEENFDGSIESGKEYYSTIKKAEEATEKLSEAQNNNNDAADNMRKSTKEVSNAINDVGAIGSASISGVTSLLGTMGIELDGALGSFVDGFDTALGALASIDLTNPVSIITGAFGVLEGIWQQTFGAAQAQRVKRANEEIERQAQVIDDLTYAYERLEKAMEESIGSDYSKNLAEQRANLEASAVAAQKQADAERAKGKSADEDAIKQFEEQAQAYRDEAEDLASLSAELMGTSKQLSQDFAQTFLEAYKTFASTSDAMKDKFKEMIDDMVANSIIGAVIQKNIIDPMLKSIDDMEGQDIDNQAAWDKILETAYNNIDSTIPILESIADRYKLGETSSDLQGIAKDIASASEESILGLAAGINTQNYYIGGIKQDTAMIVAILRGGSAGLTPLPSVDVTALITMQNGYLQNLPAIATHTANTVTECQNIVASVNKVVTRLDRVIKTKGSQTNFVVKTEL